MKAPKEDPELPSERLDEASSHARRRGPKGRDPKLSADDGEDALESSFGDVPGPDESYDAWHGAVNGGPEELDRLFRRNYMRLMRIVRVQVAQYPIVKERSAPDDIVQETFAVALRKYRDFEYQGKGSFIRWLRRIAERQINDHRRKFTTKGRDPALEVNIDAKPSTEEGSGAGFELAAEDSTPSGRASRTEEAKIVDEAVTKLSADHREVILLRDYAGEDWDDIAKLMGRRVGAAQQLHARARLRLSRLLRGEL